MVLGPVPYPRGDLKHPWDAAAVAKLNSLFARLVERIANGSEPPQWKSASKMGPPK